MKRAFIRTAYWIGFWSSRRNTRNKISFPRKWY